MEQHGPTAEHAPPLTERGHTAAAQGTQGRTGPTGEVAGRGDQGDGGAASPPAVLGKRPQARAEQRVRERAERDRARHEGLRAVERHKPAESLERQRNARRHGPWLRRPAQPGAQPHGDGMVAAPSRRDHRTAGRPRHEQRHHHLRGPHARPRGHPGRVREGRLHRQTRPRRHLAGRVQGPARRRDVPCRPGERRGMERAAERSDRRMRDDAGRRVRGRGRPADQPPARRRTARILGRGQPQRGRRTVQPVRGLHERERERGARLRPARTVRR